MARGVALVTGASRGIGMATAVELYREGWKVAITSRNLQRAQKTAFLIQKEVVDAHPCSAIIGVQYEAPSGHDKIVPTCPRKLVDTVQKDFGKITALVNACGINKDGLLVRMSDSDLKNALNANLYGPILLTKAVVKGMISQKKGSIVTLGSIVASQGNVGQVGYSASKSGLIGFTKSLAKELGPCNIRVNLVEPGFIRTQMTEHISSVKQQNLIKNIALRRFGSSEQVAKLIEFLLSDDASYITGQCIGIDGGLTL